MSGFETAIFTFDMGGVGVILLGFNSIDRDTYRGVHWWVGGARWAGVEEAEGGLP